MWFARCVAIDLSSSMSRLSGLSARSPASLPRMLARMAGIDCFLDGLKKCRRTPELKDHTAVERRKLLHASMAVNPVRAGCVSGRDVVLVDDVVTFGATFLEAGAKTVSVMALARAAKPADLVCSVAGMTRLAQIENRRR